MVMAENKSNEAGDQGRQDAAQAANAPPADAPRHNAVDINGTGYTPEEAAQETAECAGQNRQSATGGESAGHNSNFNSAPPESNVGPAGAAQNSHGFAGRPAPEGGGPTE
jgi:hypothetical protein